MSKNVITKATEGLEKERKQLMRLKKCENKAKITKTQHCVYSSKKAATRIQIWYAKPSESLDIRDMHCCTESAAEHLNKLQCRPKCCNAMQANKIALQFSFVSFFKNAALHCVALAAHQNLDLHSKNNHACKWNPNK